MITHDFINGLCVGIAVVNLIWFVAATVFINMVINKKAQKGRRDEKD